METKKFIETQKLINVITYIIFKPPRTRVICVKAFVQTGSLVLSDGFIEDKVILITVFFK